MIPYLLAALGGYLIGESQKKDSVEAPQMADGGMMAKGGEVETALSKLKKFGARIEKVNEKGSKKWYVYNDGQWGLLEDEEGFYVSDDDLIEMAEEYASEYAKGGMTDLEKYHNENGPYITEMELDEFFEKSVDRYKKEDFDELASKMGYEYDEDSEQYYLLKMAKGGKIAEDSGLYLTKKGKKTSVSGQPNPYFFGEDNEFSKGGGRYGGWWKSSSNYSIKKFEELVKERIPTDDVKFDSESGMFYAEGSDTRMRKFYRDLIDSATMNYPSEFPLKSDTEYFNWESKRFRKAKNDIKEGRDKEAIDGFYFQMFSNYGEKSIKNELKKLFKKIDSAEMGDSDSKYHISEEKAAQMVADVFKNVDKYNTEVHDTEPENNIIFFAQEKLKKRGYPRRYYVNLMDNVREYMYDEEGNYAKGGKVKSKKWIQEALTGDEGSLRRTAKRKGLLRGDENLSMTDLKKLQKMGGKTGKRAHLAETLRKFDDGGMTDYYEDLRVYVQGVGTIYKGNSLSEATDVFDEYYANNPHAEMVMVDEKYGDEIKWANTSSTDDNDD